jgi:hypothetical protein
MKNQKIFTEQVRQFANADDFERNKGALNEVEPHLQDIFIECLKRGAYLIPSITAVGVIEKIAKQSTLTQIDVIKLYSSFKQLSLFIEEKPVLIASEKKREKSWPDSEYPKIQFSSGEIAWIKLEDSDRLYLIFQDLTAGSRLKKDLPSYEIISKP